MIQQKRHKKYYKTISMYMYGSVQASQSMEKLHKYIITPFLHIFSFFLKGGQI